MLVCKELIQTIEEVRSETTRKWVEQAQKVCKKWPWPLSWLCKMVTTLIEIVETIVWTIVKTIVTIVCYFVQAIIALIEAIIKFVAGIVWRLVGVIDFIGGLIGILPVKHLRLHIVLLKRRDGSFTAPGDRIGLAIARMEEILRQRASVKVLTTVHTARRAAPSYALEVGADAQYFIDQATDAGAYYRKFIETALSSLLPAIASRVMTPIIAFVVDEVGDTQTGCSSGPLGDYFVIEGRQMIVPPHTAPVDSTAPAQPATATSADAADTLAHEIGHSCGLLHDSSDTTNLMYGKRTLADGTLRGNNLSPFQRGVIRSSTHVTYT